MNYDFLGKTTTAEERELLMNFLRLPPQKILLFASAIISSYIATFSDPKSKELLLKTVINSIKLALSKDSIILKCSFCEQPFYTLIDNANDPSPLCPKCVFPDLGIEMDLKNA